MTKYELRPENVEAVFFDSKKGSAKHDYNWHDVELLVGQHQTEIDHHGEADTDKIYAVFDVEYMKWLYVDLDTYVVKDALGGISLWSKEKFEKKFTPARINYHVTPGIVPSQPWQPHWGPLAGAQQLQRNVD